MKTSFSHSTTAAFVAVALLALTPVDASAQSVRNRYAGLHEREQRALARISDIAPDAPAAVREALIRDTRSVIAGYDALVRRYHSSGYADNALWNAAILSEALFKRFNQRRDHTAAARYRKRLIAEYPSSSLIKQAKAASLPDAPEDTPDPAPTSGSTPARTAPASSSGRALLTAIDREVLPEGVRVTLSLDREVSYREERLAGPERVFFDLRDVQVAPELRDVVLRYTEDIVRQIRVGRHPESTVRVVLDLEGTKKYSVFTLYNPFRVVVDCEPEAARPTAAVGFGEGKPSGPREAAPVPAPASAPTEIIATGAPSPNTTVPLATAPPIAKAVAQPPIPVAKPSVVPEPPAIEPPGPSAPSSAHSNAAGGFSLSRQLGLGVSRIVIDPGHGGHDPGAMGKGLNEADLTLDVALRLEKLLHEEGLEVVLTRRDNVYIPLEERTAIANRESADLFLSIHANASRNLAASGVETYFLSFAATPEAEAVAARENSASSSGMHNLPDIIKAIALNNKLDESRDFASMVQEALVSRLRRSNKGLRNLGVKKAPFVVLIGAGMPSVLAEISFLTNRHELQLLKTNAYKQRVAEALHASILRYRRSLKGQGQVAEQ
jgi:N-acetylmuramoyl-L-alanine amidase